MAFNLPTAPGLDDPLMGFRFGVFFLGGPIGIAHPLDFRFQSVSGLSVSVETSNMGKEPFVQQFPERVNYSNLQLKRGMPLVSTLRREIQQSFDSFRFYPRNVLLSILDENALPTSSWLFSEAFPVKWSLSGLDADSSSVIIEEMELSYTQFKAFSL